MSPRTERSINWGIVGLLITVGVALLAREWVLHDAIDQKANASEVVQLKRDVSANREAAKVLEERLANIQATQQEVRSDVKEILRKVK